jgi:hypothetical protein
MLPVLKLAANGETRVPLAADEIANVFGLTYRWVSGPSLWPRSTSGSLALTHQPPQSQILAKWAFAPKITPNPDGRIHVRTVDNAKRARDFGESVVASIAGSGCSSNCSGRGSFGRFVMRLHILVAGFALLALSACATTPESRIRSSLINLGLSQHTASCMAANVSSKLTKGQIETLSRLSGLNKRKIGEMTIGEFTHLLTRSGNAEMVAIFARAGIGCAILNW